MAIELAVARLKLLSPQALLARLEHHRLDSLTSGAQDLPARQQMLHSTLKWSYNLLDEDEQRLFRRLSVFVGGCTLEAVEALSATLGDVALDVLDGVASLLDKSQVQRIEQVGDEPRLLMLETIREYGLELLATHGEMEATQDAHAAYYLRLSEQAEPHLTGAEQGRWFTRLEREYENLRAALRWLVERAETGMKGEQAEMALRLGRALWGFWTVRGHWSEGRHWLERALAASQGVVAAVRAKALNAAGMLAYLQDDLARAEALCGESLALFRELAVRAPADSTFKGGIASSLIRLGQVAKAKGNYPAARALLEESLALRKEVGDRGSVARSLSHLASVVAFQGDVDVARTLFEQSLALLREVDDEAGMASCLAGLAGVIAAQGEPVRAVLLRGAVESLRETLSVPIPPGEHARYDRGVAVVRVQLGEKAFAAAWAEGRTMTPEQALVAQGQATMLLPSKAVSTEPLPTYPAGLSAREVEVLRLIAEGLTNTQIAERLVISPLTVNAHVRSIYNKLEVSSRSAATRFAIQHHLICEEHRNGKSFPKNSC